MELESGNKNHQPNDAQKGTEQQMCVMAQKKSAATVAY